MRKKIKEKNKDRRIHRSTLQTVLIAFVVGIVALTFSFTISWGDRMKNIETTSSSDVFAEFETETLWGDAFTDEDTKARVTAYNVWETTCPACLGEMGALEKLSQKYPPEEFQLIGICDDLYDKSGKLKPGQVKKAQSLMEDAGVTFPNIIPTKDMSAFFKSVIPGYPTTFFVDQEGKIVSTTSGANDLEEWTEKVDEILGTEK